ncbi:MAG: DsrE/DsrF/DrsH-like family protein [Parabacteroides merdae]
MVAATIRKQEKTASCEISREQCRQQDTDRLQRHDLDKALASFVIANGAASTGKKVTMLLFTFWGLNVIKKQHKPTVTKDIFGKMFGWMLPTHSGKLKLSKMNMGGAGSWMMRLIMKRKRIDSLESLIQQAHRQWRGNDCLHHDAWMSWACKKKN